MRKAPEIQAGTRLRSMTGYAETTAELEGITLTVSLRSVNHRFLDLRLHLPDQLLVLESKIRKQIQAGNPRGHLDVRVNLDWKTGTSAVVDEGLILRYLQLFQKLETEYGLSPAADAATLCRLPGVVTLAGGSAGREIPPQLEDAFWKALEETLERWDSMRAEEAQFLVEDMQERATGILRVLSQVVQWQAEMLPLTQKKLQERVQVLLEQPGLDANRLAQEAALLAERTDSSEEVLRLQSHLTQLRGLLEGESDAGRKLDFLLQEILRELNTLLAKTASLGEGSLPITQAGLEMKAEVEKLREQVQNLQ
ncbi:MAG: YicC family protein [Acidobacteria bacterium]|nr:YicC family protein [Acidobacteriota bacterium]